MIKRFMGVAAGAAAISGSGVAEEKPYELIAATLEGRPTWAIVDHNGTAVAIELRDEAPEIIQGLAAGAILSDLREVSENEGRGQFSISSGTPYSEIEVDGEIRIGRASRKEADLVIEDLPHLSDDQKNELRSILSLH